MNAKTAKEKRARESLKGRVWAKPLLATLEGQSGSEGFLFELRFAHEIARAGVTPSYEHKTGVGNSTVDFCLSSGAVQWHVELVTVEASAAVADAAVRESIGPGIEVETMTLGREASRVDGVPLTAKQTPESELLRIMSKLEAKVADSRGRPIKFPPPEPGVYSMVLIDMRRFEGIGAPDRDHCRQIVRGPGLVRHEGNVMSHPDGAPIFGLWDAANPRAAAQIARERVHVLGRERTHAVYASTVTSVTSRSNGATVT